MDIYFAAICDVRGSIKPGYFGENVPRKPTISILVRDEETARAALEYFGCGKIWTRESPHNPRHINYQWKVDSYDGYDKVVQVVARIAPHLRANHTRDVARRVLEAAEQKGAA